MTTPIMPPTLPKQDGPESKCSCYDCIRWQAEHDGRINAWWYTQHRWNEEIEKELNALTKRMTAQEKRQMWLSGASAAGGAMAGVLLGWVLQNILGG